jgi:hypothetical protein
MQCEGGEHFQELFRGRYGAAAEGLATYLIPRLVRPESVGKMREDLTGILHGRTATLKIRIEGPLTFAKAYYVQVGCQRDAVQLSYVSSTGDCMPAGLERTTEELRLDDRIAYAAITGRELDAFGAFAGHMGACMLIRGVPDALGTPPVTLQFLRSHVCDLYLPS